MTKLSAVGLLLLVFTVSSVSNAHNQDRTNSNAKMFPLQLLPGYKVFSGSGIDSSSAKIWRDGSVTIELSQGLYVGVDVDSIRKEDVAWREEQIVNGERVICVYTKSNEFVVSIPRLAVNFRGHIQNQQEIAEMLLMVLTYEPRHGYAVEPGAIVPVPQNLK
jgi:hypothetical protein